MAERSSLSVNTWNDVQVATRSPTPARPASVAPLAPTAMPSRMIPARPRVMIAGDGEMPDGVESMALQPKEANESGVSLALSIAHGAGAVAELTFGGRAPPDLPSSRPTIPPAHCLLRPREALSDSTRGPRQTARIRLELIRSNTEGPFPP
jgi:hypothetical protein